jgi:TolA-binding protein
MWRDRIKYAKDVWALHPKLVGRVTVQCMNALYRLQALQSEAISQLTGLAQTAKLTLDDREGCVVDLSSELVEKDLQAKQMGTRIRELEEQVEVRDNTIEVLENQLQTTQQQLEEANEHLDMHHQEMHQDMEAEEDVDIEGEEKEDPEELEPASSLDTASLAHSGGPPSPESSATSIAS